MVKEIQNDSTGAITEGLFSLVETPEPKQEEVKEAKSLNIQQTRAANLLLFLEISDLFSKVSKKHATSKKEGRKLAKGLEDYYFAQGNLSALKKFISRWGENSRTIYELYEDEICDRVEELEDKILADSKKYNLFERIKIGLRVGRRLAGWNTSYEHKEKILSLSGYSKKDIVALGKKLGISAGFSLGLGAVYWLASAAAFTQGLTDPIFEDVDKREAGAILGLSYLVNYGTSVINSIQNVRLLGNKNIQNSPNLTSTSTYLVLNKLLVNREKKKVIRDGTVVALTTSLSAWKEPGIIPFAMSSEAGLSAVALSYFVVGGVNLLQAGGDEVVLRTWGKSDNQ